MVTVDLAEPAFRLQMPERPQVSADVIIALAGHAGSGKSMLASAVAAQYPGVEVVRFVDAVRDQAEAAGKSGDDPYVLIDVGAQWVQSDALGLCLRVLKSIPRPSRMLLVEGVHHDIVRSLLDDLVAPKPISLVLLKSSYHDIVDRFMREGKTAEQAARVLADSTEVDVDRALLAHADLVLDASDELSRNATKVIELAEHLLRNGESLPPIIGGLDREQRISLVNDIATEFGWLLPSEVANRMGLVRDEVERLRQERQLLGAVVGGATLYPAFTLADAQPNLVVAATLAQLADIFTDWEVLSWLMAANGYLDGARPVDASVDHVQEAIEAELAAD